MDNREHLGRRRFVLGVLPACAGACVALRGLASAQSAAAPAQPPAKRHKFDSEIPRKVTYRDGFALTYSRAFIPLVLFMSRKMGREATVELLKASATEQATGQAAAAIKGVGGADFAAFKRALDNPAVANVWTKDVVEDTESAFELRVTECLWAATFRAANAGEEGFAAVCQGDYAFATAFNPKLKLVRDKTLMQGQAYCNHRYLWKA